MRAVCSDSRNGQLTKRGLLARGLTLIIRARSRSLSHKEPIMKSTAFVTAIALLAAVFSVAANADTGAPSAQEVGRAATATPSAPVSAETQPGSYARYLMLNGETREQALRDARNIDNPAPTRFAWHGARNAAPAAAQQ
jgi:hypothetical protein